MIEEVLASYRSVIVLDNGEKNPWVPERGVVIAADGAADQVDADLIVGDGDSISRKNRGEFIQIIDQNHTDFEKCIWVAKERDLLPSMVIGINGGEIDHILGNAFFLLKYAENFSLFFVDFSERGTKIGLPFSEGNFVEKVEKGATISMISYGKVRISTKGLVWDLTDQVLAMDGLFSLRNRAEKEEVSWEIHEGKVLIIMDFTPECY